MEADALDRALRIMFVAGMGSFASMQSAWAEEDVWFKGTANEFSIEFVEVSDPGNPAKTGTGYLFNPGAVPYNFRIAKYEVAWGQCRRLCSETKLAVTIEPAVKGVADEEDRPCSKVIPMEVFLMANQLNLAKGYHACYNITGDNVMKAWPKEEAWNEGGEINLLRHKDCMYFVPSIHEYFKAAQWDPKSKLWLNYGQGSTEAPIPINGFYGGDALPNTSVYRQVLDERHPEWNYFYGNGNVLKVTLTVSNGGITALSYQGYVSGFSRNEDFTTDFTVTQKGGLGGKAKVTAYQTLQVPAEFSMISSGAGYNNSSPNLTSQEGTVTLGDDSMTVRVWARDGHILGLYPLAGRFSVEDTSTVLNIVQSGGSGGTCRVSRYFGVLVPSAFHASIPGSGYSNGEASIKTADQTNIWQANQPWQGAAPVKRAGGLSPWGVMALDGNVHEYSDSAHDGINDMVSESSRFTDERELFFSSYWNEQRGWKSGHPSEHKQFMERITANDSAYEAGFRFASKVLPRPPTVTLTSPREGAVFHTGTEILFYAEAVSERGVEINSVEFSINGSIDNEDSSAPYSYGRMLPAGEYRVCALATDGRGLRTVTPEIVITVQDGVVYGDLSNDGQIMAQDAWLVARYAVELVKDPEVPELCGGLSAEEFRRRGDVDGVAGLSANDAMLIARRAVGLIDRFPVENE